MIIHVVRRGDTVAALARRYGVTVSRIISDNSLSNPSNLVIGQALIILIPETVYTVRPGDTLTSIAARYGTTVSVLLQNNPSLTPDMTLRSGQVITIRFAEKKRREFTVNGYAYPYIRRDILTRSLPYLTYLTIFSYGFTDSGDLIDVDDAWMIRLAYRYKTAPVMALSSISEDGRFNSVLASMLFQNTELQNHLMDQVIETMHRKGYVGLDIDFEYIQPQDREAFLLFLENAASRLHAEGFFMNTDLAPKISSMQSGLLYEAHDYAAIGEITNTALLMTYEWGYTAGPPMAVAPLNRVQEVVAYAVTQIPSEKILMGIPNYGYDWPLPFERGVTTAVSIGNEYAVQIAARYGAQILFDPPAQSPFFEYYNRRSTKHVVWFEDVRSIAAKLELMEQYQLRGCSYWNLMRPFQQNWALLSARYHVRKVVL